MTHPTVRIAGVDLGDTHSHVCVLDTATGDVIEETRIRTTQTSFTQYFSRSDRMRVALETGTHSPWASRVVTACGHESIVANARQVRLVHASKRKNDRLDAEKLARLARYDQNLLAPVRHRSQQAQADLAVLRSRDALVRCRTLLINHVRSVTKSFGARLPKCSSSVFHQRAAEYIPDAIRPALQPHLDSVTRTNEQIDELDARIKKLATDAYPESQLLTQVKGVAEITALSFILTLEDPTRFQRSRAVGAYLGLSPGQHQSGERDPGKRISKEGDETLRRLLVQCAHRILGRFGQDSDLRRHGERIIKQGGSKAKRRAVVAVARKLAVLLHHLWATAEVYEPLKNSRRNRRTPKPRTETAVAT